MPVGQVCGALSEHGIIMEASVDVIDTQYALFHSNCITHNFSTIKYLTAVNQETRGDQEDIWGSITRS
jgi:hypothetical protein